MLGIKYSGKKNKWIRTRTKFENVAKSVAGLKHRHLGNTVEYE